MAGWFEIANVDEHLQALAGRPADPPFRLGTLATAWPTLRPAATATELTALLTRSAWRDPGGETPRDIQLGMRLAWADRVAARIGPARPWASAATALLVARERFLRGSQLSAAGTAVAVRLLGPAVPEVTGLPDLVAVLPGHARWVFDGIAGPDDLWRAEPRWWHRVQGDASRLVAGSGFGPEVVVGAAALLAADAWLVRGALAVAAHGGTPVEVLDGLA
jgi:hypothetical protein